MAKLRPLLERVLPIAVLAVSAVSVPVMILSPTGLPRLRALEGERRDVDRHVSRISREVRELREVVKRIKSDPAGVELVARDELGLVRQSELVYQFRD
jgi:cell division protein FtsB